MAGLRSLVHGVLPYIIQNRLARQIKSVASRKVIKDYAEYCNPGTSRRALLSYLVLPLVPPHHLRDRVLFSNRGIAQVIPKVLNELGYVVDIVNFDHTTWKPDRPYDLFIGHGGIRFQHIAQLLPGASPRVYFSTGIYWRDLNVREARRLYEFTLRTGYLLPPDRFVKHDEEGALKAADGIICLGNQSAAQSYSTFPNVACLNNAAYPVVWEGFKRKDYAAGRAHFLFFSGRGNIHKGLDRLLEVFRHHPELHLHICQHLESDFVDIYKEELSQYPQIHVHNYVPMRSSAFETLALQCNWIILPTCAEGQPGSVIECMAYGLIPILPPTANIDLEDWGVDLGDCAVATIENVISIACNMEASECMQRSERVIEAARRDYSVEQFHQSFKDAVLQIIANVSRAH
ncbi:MAG: hypothetical protein NVS2B7_10070 [Herpetosiphon sp.]